MTETRSATQTQTFTESATPVPEPYTVTVNIFNSAGELVRSLYTGTSENSAEQAQVLATSGANGGTQVNITGLDGNAGADLVWNSTNNGSQAVGAGVYTVQIQTKNNFGQIQTQTQMVTVMSAAGPASLSIFNSAGELVANLSGSLAGQSSAPIGMSLVLPNGQSGVIAAAAGSPSGGLLIKVTFANGSTQTVPWSGLSSQGQPLQPGNYLATLSQAEPGSDTVVKSVPFVLLDTANSSASGMANSALVIPNPVDANWFTVQFQPAGNDTAVARLYDLSGQLVAEGVSDGTNSLRLSGTWSGGVYLLDFEVHGVPAGVLARRVLKVAIVR
ncbi:MAG TPA: T9SS type A sorting domain-containing protein [bacterium]|nr:T9SS type A sorting domain-containing protein [bacterium]